MVVGPYLVWFASCVVCVFEDHYIVILGSQEVVQGDQVATFPIAHGAHYCAYVKTCEEFWVRVFFRWSLEAGSSLLPHPKSRS